MLGWFKKKKENKVEEGESADLVEETVADVVEDGKSAEALSGLDVEVGEPVEALEEPEIPERNEKGSDLPVNLLEEATLEEEEGKTASDDGTDVEIQEIAQEVPREGTPPKKSSMFQRLQKVFSSEKIPEETEEADDKISPEVLEEGGITETVESDTLVTVAEPVIEDPGLDDTALEEEAEAEEEVLVEEKVESDEEDQPPVEVQDASREQEKPERKSMFQRLQERLGKTRNSLVSRLDSLFLGKKEIDQELFDELEEILITADLGVATSQVLLDSARKVVKRDQLSDPMALRTIIQKEIHGYLMASDQPAELVMPEKGPFVFMVVGVNGVGKTTTIGNIAAKFINSGQSVLLVAGDTFRAAAIDQLKIWGERVNAEVVAQKPGADPSSVVFDGIEYGTARGFDVVIIDTAGRLHTSVNLMEELKKIKRVISKKLEGAPHEIMLVIDSTTGQNGISQAKYFNEAVGVTGLTLTKLDGTAKGGIVANICRELKIPVRFIGIGEQVDDLRDFEPNEFIEALFNQQLEDPVAS